MSKPNYRVLLSFDGERKVFIARAPELEHCAGEGPSRAEAIAKLEEEIDAQVQNILAHGSHPPAAVDETEWSGEIALKLSKGLHRDLAWQARSEGIDVAQLASELLAAALEGRQESRGRARPSGNRAHVEHAPHDNIGNSRGPRSYGQQRYQGVMEDRANFIEYVRGLDGGGYGAQQRGPGGGGGGPNMHGGGRRRRRGGGSGGGRSFTPNGGPGGNSNGNPGGNGTPNGTPGNGPKQL